MNLKRRHFMTITAATAIGFSGMKTLFATDHLNQLIEPFGALKNDPDGLLDLPEGFSYKIISKVGDTMDDGLMVPGKPDGMATFQGSNGRTILIRNHEMETHQIDGPFGNENNLLQAIQDKIYDAGKNNYPCLGGTSTIIYDTKNQKIEKQFLSLGGTLRNCAGGPTPWNTWITCEEATDRAGEELQHDHGYNFEVPATEESTLVDPVPLKQMGRFRHEAIAVDPKSSIIYQTEDLGDGLIYRYIPNEPGKPAKGGKLQALAIQEQKSLDTRNWDQQLVAPGESLVVNWIDMEDVESPNDDLRYQGFDKGAARFARGEGMWTGNDAIYFACTNGGSKKKGQIWKYKPSPVEGTSDETKQPGTLELFVESNDANVIENADNLTVSPWGDLIVCEDSSDNQDLVGITPEGKLYKFAHHVPGNSEFAGVTFSPNGDTLFVNIQHTGLTLAITGPWDEKV